MMEIHFFIFASCETLKEFWDNSPLDNWLNTSQIFYRLRSPFQRDPIHITSHTCSCVLLISSLYLIMLKTFVNINIFYCCHSSFICFALKACISSNSTKNLNFVFDIRVLLKLLGRESFYFLISFWFCCVITWSEISEYLGLSVGILFVLTVSFSF